jgi:hypothetical protein
VVGTVILFGFLIVALSLYQVQVVPQENTNVEFEHSQQVEGEFLDLRNAVLSASRTGDGRSTSLKLGTRYPQRTFTLNPPPASGRLSTTEPRELRIENVTVEGDENVVKYWTNRTSADGAITFETRSLRYSPDYNEFRNEADLVYEHSLVVAEFDSTALGRTGQTVVDEDRLRLTALDGNVDTSGVERTTLDPEALSQSRRTVRLSSTGGDPIVLELPTDVSMDQAESLEQQWRDRLGTDVERVSVAGETVRIRLSGSETYRLELGKVGFGTDTSAPNESTEYIRKVSSNGGVAVVEVRDQFNNPVVGADVTVDNGTEQTVRADEDGRVSYEVLSGSQDVMFSINGGADDWEDVTFENLNRGSGEGGDRGPSSSTQPEFTNGPTATPNTVAQGDSFNLSATVNNIGLGGTDIVNATWEDDQGNSGTFISADGSFDQPAEDIESSIDTTGWNPGTHTINVTATDGNVKSVSDEIEVEITQSPGLADRVELDESDTQVNNGDLVVRFRNDNSQPVTFERARLVEYDEASAPGNRDPIGIVEYQYGNVELAEGDPIEDVAGPTVSNGANVDITFSPVPTGASGNSGTNAKVQSGDTIEFTIEFDDGSQRAYQYTVP